MVWPVPMEFAEIVYRLNDDDEIVFVNDEWDRWAMENLGDVVIGPRIIGRSIWNFISGTETEEYYRQAIAQVRAGRRITFTFRCDAPDCRRLLRMTLESADNNQLQFTTTPIATELRAHEEFFNALADRHESSLCVCSWCRRIFLDGQWQEVDELQLRSDSPLPRITHGICDDCRSCLATSLAGD